MNRAWATRAGLDRHELASLATLAWPVVVAQLGFMLLGVVDTILVARFDPSVNTLLFLPQEGAPIEEFEAGDHTIVLTYWPEVEGRQAAKQLSWTFRVT